MRENGPANIGGRERLEKLRHKLQLTPEAEARFRRQPQASVADQLKTLRPDQGAVPLRPLSERPDTGIIQGPQDIPDLRLGQFFNSDQTRRLAEIRASLSAERVADLDRSDLESEARTIVDNAARRLSSGGRSLDTSDFINRVRESAGLERVGPEPIESRATEQLFEALDKLNSFVIRPEGGATALVANAVASASLPPGSTAEIPTIGGRLRVSSRVAIDAIEAALKTPEQPVEGAPPVVGSNVGSPVQTRSATFDERISAFQDQFGTGESGAPTGFFGAAEVIGDPLNLLPIVGFGPDIVRGVRGGAAAAGAATRQSASAVDNLARVARQRGLDLIQDDGGFIRFGIRSNGEDAAEATLRQAGALASDSVAAADPSEAFRVLDLSPIKPGLTRTQEALNLAKRTIGRPFGFDETDPMIAGAFGQIERGRRVAESQAVRLSATWNTAIRRDFVTDKFGGIPALADIEGGIQVVAPTIQDVAARLPVYEPHLSGPQMATLRGLREQIAQYKTMLDEVGEEIGLRPDVMEGGFYIPRGNAEVLDNIDLPTSRIRRGSGKPGFEKAAVFDSMAEGIENGYRYPPIGDVLQNYAGGAGRRAASRHGANYLKAATDTNGDLIASTPKMRALKQSPQVIIPWEQLKANLARLRALRDRLSTRTNRVVARFLDDPEFDDIDNLRDALTVRVARGKNVGESFDEVLVALRETVDSLRTLRPEYKRALERARATPREAGRIQLSGLEQHAFPDAMARSAESFLPATGRGTLASEVILSVPNAVANLYRAARATLDNSGPGIQGLLALGNDLGRAGLDPRKLKALGTGHSPVGEALKVNIRAWGPNGEQVLGAFIATFDGKAAQAGTLNSAQWARRTLHLGGRQTEFFLGGSVLTRKLASLPGVRVANRAFGFFGDALRLEWADDLLRTELARGRALDEIIQSGDAGRIAQIANNMTGWTEGRAFGSIGDLFLFAPRFLQSRIETVAKASMGMRPGASLDQRIARNSMARFIGTGTLLTVILNEMLGNDTDFQPWVNGRPNSNFMRVRWMGRDWSLFGTWDSLLRATMLTASGRPQDALRGLASGPVSMSWDMWTGENFVGEPTRDNPLQFAWWMARQGMPFSAEEFASGDAFRNSQEEFVGFGALGASIVGEMMGTKSAPVTARERLDEGRLVALAAATDGSAIEDLIRVDENGTPLPFDRQPADVRTAIDETEQVAASREAVERVRRQRRSDFQAYQDERTSIVEASDQQILAEQARLGVGPALRERIDQIRERRAIDLENLRNNSADTLAFINDIAPNDSDLDLALDDYFNAVTDPGLEDPQTGEFDYDQRDLRLQGLRGLWGDEMIGRVEEFARRNDVPVVAELREARADLKPYWEIADDVELLGVPLEQRGEWETYLGLHWKEKVRFAEERRLTFYAARLDLERGRFRVLNEDIDTLLVRWYGYPPRTREGFEEQQGRRAPQARTPQRARLELTPEAIARFSGN